MQKKYLKNWSIAIRPKTLLASIGPVILGLSAAYIEIHHINILVAALTLICAILLQIASNLANDYLDDLSGVDNNARLGPTRASSSGLITHLAMRRALILTLSLAFLIGLYLMYVGGTVIVVIGLFSLYFAYGYTGGPFPLSHNGLGEIAAFIFFGIIAVFGTTYLQTHQYSKLPLILGIGPGFISACILAINNLRDIATDREGHKRTLAVRFGEKFQRHLCISAIFLSALLPFYIMVAYGYEWILPAFILPLVFHQTWLQILYGPIGHTLNLALQRTALYNLLYCLLLSLGILMSQGQ